MKSSELNLRLLLPLLLLTLQTGSAAARGDKAGQNSATRPREATRETVTKAPFLGPPNGWGFVQSASPYYSPLGKNLGTLPGGTLFTYKGVKASSKNAVLVSSVKRGDAWEGPYLLDCTALAVYEGSPDALDPQTLQNLGAFFAIKGQIAAREAELAQESLAANPHYASAKQAQQAYQTSVDKAAEMEKQMNTLSGERKSKSLDALRAFKYEQVRIKAKADQEAAAYKAWKDAHPADLSKQSADPRLRELEKSLQTAKAKVSTLVPQS